MWDCKNNASDIKNKIVELKATVPGSMLVPAQLPIEAEKEAQYRHPWRNMLENATKKYRDPKL